MVDSRVPGASISVVNSDTTIQVPVGTHEGDQRYKQDYRSVRKKNFTPVPQAPNNQAQPQHQDDLGDTLQKHRRRWRKEPVIERRAEYLATYKIPTYDGGRGPDVGPIYSVIAGEPKDRDDC